MTLLRDCLAQAKQEAPGKIIERCDGGAPQYIPHSVAEQIFASMLDTDATYENGKIFIEGRLLARLQKWAVSGADLLSVSPTELLD